MESQVGGGGSGWGVTVDVNREVKFFVKFKKKKYFFFFFFFLGGGVRSGGGGGCSGAGFTWWM